MADAKPNRDEITRALIQGARKAGTEYVSVRRADLLAALGADSAEQKGKPDQNPPPGS